MLKRSVARKGIFFVLTGLSLLLILWGGVCCRRGPPPVDTGAEAGRSDYHGTRFGSFIEQLASLPVNRRDSAVRHFISLFPRTPLIESDTVFSLYWYGQAGHVVVNGDLQSGWSAPDTLYPVTCGDSTFFCITYTVPSDTRLDYQLCTDSVYTTDPSNPVITPSGYGAHSEIAMPDFHPNPILKYRPEVPHGTLDSLMFESRDPALRPRPVKVYLPADYDSLSTLPVLYVMDGLEALEYMSYTDVLDNLIADGRIVPLIVVFIPPGERHIEYIGDLHHAFITALCEEMVPLTDRTYKTAAHAGKRGITGISSGGHLALLAAMSRPEVFGCGAGQSPTITDEIVRAMHSLSKKDKTLPRPDIYFDVGRFDLPNGSLNNWSFLQAAEYLHQKMELKGIKHVFRIVDDGHEWANWRQRMDDILEYFFGK
jgi:enterochelin esterase-like enzyme